MVAPSNQDTLEAHARAQDDEGLKRASLDAAEQIEGRADEVRSRRCWSTSRKSWAQLLAEISQRATKGEDDAEKAAAIWALVHAEDMHVAAAALVAWDSGVLARVKKLDGTAALDLGALARLVAQASVPEEHAARRRKVIAAALPSVTGSSARRSSCGR